MIMVTGVDVERCHYTIETYLSLMYKVPPFLKGDV